MGLFDHFPYTNVHELNLDWIMEQLLTLKTTIEQFVSINALKYANPIQWNITKQYEKNTIVIDPNTGTAYISVQPVPAGVNLTNTDYWTVVFDLGSFVVRAAKNFTTRYEADTTLTATFSSNANDWIVWGDTLYRAATNITAGDQYVVGSNIIAFTVEDVVGHIQALATTDKSNLVAAINELVQALIDEANRVDNITGDPDNLTTTDKSNLVAAINEVLNNLNTVSTSLNGRIDKLLSEVLIFAKNEDNASLYNGNATVLNSAGKSALIDASYNNNLQNVVDAINKANVTKLDAVIISHYHADHANINNLNQLVTLGYITAATKFYLARPAVEFSCWDSSLQNTYDSLIALINTLGASYIIPENGDTITLGNCEILFCNNELADQTAISLSSNDYNNYCLACYITNDNVRIGMFGDLYSAGQKQIYDSGYAYKCNIVTACHHGDASANGDFQLCTMPDYAVAMSCTKHLNVNSNLAATEVAYLSTHDCRVVGTNRDMVIFSFNANQFVLNRYYNTDIIGADYNINVDIHVDHSTTDPIENGSAAHPFKRYSQALGLASRFKNCYVSIYGDGVFEDKSYTLNGYRARVIIDNINIKSINFYDGNYELTNSTLTATSGNCIVVRRSKVSIVGCTMTGDTTGTGAAGAAINAGSESELLLAGTNNISNKSRVLKIGNISNAELRTITGSGNEYIVENTEAGCRVTGTGTYSGVYTAAAVTASSVNCYGTLIESIDKSSDLTVPGTLIFKKLGDNLMQIRLDLNSITMTGAEKTVGTISDTSLRPKTQQDLAGHWSNSDLSVRGSCALRLQTNGNIVIYAGTTDYSNVSNFFAGGVFSLL